MFMAYPDTIKTDQDVLNAFVAVAPYLNRVIRQEVVVCVTNTEKNLITVLNDKVKFSPAVGAPAKTAARGISAAHRPGQTDPWASI